MARARGPVHWQRRGVHRRYGTGPVLVAAPAPLGGEESGSMHRSSLPSALVACDGSGNAAPLPVPLEGSRGPAELQVMRAGRRACPSNPVPDDRRVILGFCADSRLRSDRFTGGSMKMRCGSLYAVTATRLARHPHLREQPIQRGSLGRGVGGPVRLAAAACGTRDPRVRPRLDR